MNANAPHDANAVACDCDVDHTIDRALSALRDAAPRPGLEGRILASLEHRAATPQSARFHISAHIALWTATSAAILALASLAVLRHRTTTPESAQTNVQPNVSGSAQLRVPQVSTLRPGFRSSRLAGERTARIARHPERSAIGAKSKDPDIARRATNAEPFSTTNTTPTDTQLLADLHAPSHPAPPLPLTPQEKLFLRMLRYGNLTQLAELDPIVRAAHDADEATAFKAFFPDPPPLHQPGDPE